MLKIFLSSTYRDLAEYRSKILEKLNAAFEGVGMEQFIPDGSNSQEVCIGNLIKNNVVIFLISSYYGSLMESCSLKEDCKAVCPMKTGFPIPPENRISYTHCEYKTTVAEGILHQTYLIEKGWDNIPADIRKQALEFKKEIGEEYLGFIDIEDPKLVQMICSNLATKIIEWHTQDKLDFEKFCDREEVLNELLESIDSKVEVWGVGGIGKTALIELALLIQKLKGKRILTIGTSRAYASGSGFEDFRTKCEDEQYIAESRNEITIYDVINAFVENGLLPNAEDIRKLPKDEKIEILAKKIRSEKKFILFIDDFHLANDDVAEVAKAVDHLILSSRKNTYIARKEIYLSGIDKKDRENLIKLFSTEIPENVMELINKIAEGHPVSTELLVKNYQNIDFDKIKDFDLADADDTQVRDFYKRVIEEIFSTNTQALTLLKDLAILNPDLSTNMHRESVLNSYDSEGIRKAFKNLIDTGMIKKRYGSEGTYEFYFKHIQDYLEEEVEKESHEKALLYYKKKREILNDKYTFDDDVEVIYHKVKLAPTKGLVDELLTLGDKLHPVHYGFKRFLDVGNDLQDSLDDVNKAHILHRLGRKYYKIGRYDDYENSQLEALTIFKELSVKDPDTYLNNVGDCQRELGILYDHLNKFERSEIAYLESLEIYKALAKKDPDTYKAKLRKGNIAGTLHDIGNLYRKWNKFDDSEKALKMSLTIYKKLAEWNPDRYLYAFGSIQNSLGALYADLEKFEEAETYYQGASGIIKDLAVWNPDAYLPAAGVMKDNLGNFYANLERFEGAEITYQEALDIRKKLAAKSPDAYLYAVAETLFSLGNLYSDLKRYEEAETAYTEALDIRKELADKNPDAYLPDVAGTQNNLGVLYRNLGRFAEAETAYIEALNTYGELADQNRDIYLLNVAMMQNNLGALYTVSGRFEEAEKIYNKALNIYNPLAEKNPDVYGSKIALIWYNKACLESLRDNKEKSIESLKKAIELDITNIENAKSNEDFDNIRTSKEFKEIIGE